MKALCIKCGETVIALASENPQEVICIDCHAPALQQAARAATAELSDIEYKRTGVRRTGNEILRQALGFE